MKLCIDCKYERFTGLGSVCTYEAGISPVTGRSQTHTCETMRGPGASCGPEGLQFIPKIPPVPDLPSK